MLTVIHCCFLYAYQTATLYASIIALFDIAVDRSLASLYNTTVCGFGVSGRLIIGSTTVIVVGLKSS